MRIVRSRAEVAQAFAACQAEAERGLRLLGDLLREVHRGGAARRGAGAGRQERHARAPGRARLLGPAPPPEARRGVAGAGAGSPRRAPAPQGGRWPWPPPVNYVSAGTVEFLVDSRTRPLLLHRDEHAHPGRAPGHRDDHRPRPGPRADPDRRRRAPGLSPGRVALRGHAIECRINAEDPVHLRAQRRARHRAGSRRRLRRAGGQPPDGAVRRRRRSTTSLLAKIIVHGPRSGRGHRAHASGRWPRRSSEGVKTTIPFHLRVLADPAFVEGGFTSVDGARLTQRLRWIRRSTSCWTAPPARGRDLVDLLALALTAAAA